MIQHATNMHSLIVPTPDERRYVYQQRLLRQIEQGRLSIEEIERREFNGHNLKQRLQAYWRTGAS